VRVLAREWLIFLLLLPLGFPTAFLLGYWQLYAPYRHNPYFIHLRYDGFDDFWNHALGWDSPWAIAAWFVPYVAVLLIRSVWSSVKLVLQSKRTRYAAAVYLVLLVLGLGAFASRAYTDAKARRDAAHRPNIFDQFDDLVPKASPHPQAPAFDPDKYLRLKKAAVPSPSTTP